jgi:hypothetical protein
VEDPTSQITGRNILSPLSKLGRGDQSQAGSLVSTALILARTQISNSASTE